MRMLMNNLDPEVAEHPDQLIVYGGSGRAARSWEAFDSIVATLRGLADDETMLVQSGKPVGVLRTHEWAPRVLIANSLLVPQWATWDEFRRLESLGLTMFGQMTAGSWIYIGTQGILQGTYETFAELARQRFGGTLRGTVTLTAGLGGMGGAQPLAVTMNEGVVIAIEVDEHRAARRRDPLPRPGRVPDLPDPHLAHPRLPQEPVADVLVDEVHARAGRGSERQVQLHHLTRPANPVDQPQVHDRDGELGIHDIPEGAPEAGTIRFRGGRRVGVRGCGGVGDCYLRCLRGRRFPPHSHTPTLPHRRSGAHRQRPPRRHAAAPMSFATESWLRRMLSTYCSFIGPRAFQRAKTCSQLIAPSSKSQRLAAASYSQGKG